MFLSVDILDDMEMDAKNVEGCVVWLQKYSTRVSLVTPALILII